MRSINVYVLVVVATALALLAAPASAQDTTEEPLRLVFLNSDPSDGPVVYSAVEEVLEASEDIELIDPGRLLDAGTGHDVSLETFRSGDQREEHEAEFQEMIDAIGAEAVMILDVFGSGRTMQLVLVGPWGNELADVRQTISRGEPSRGEVVAGLKQSFKTLVPEVRDYREWQKEQQESQAEVDLLGEEDDVVVDETIKDRAVDDHRARHGGLSQGLTPTVGVIMGQRSIVLDTEAPYTFDHSSPFVGFGLDVNTILALFDGDTRALGVSLHAAYAPFTTIFKNNGEEVEVPSAYTNAHLDLEYVAGLGTNFIARGNVGFELATISIEQNQAYTGNSYVNMRVGAGIIYRIGQLAELHLDAAALPVLDAKMSGDRFGEADFAVAWNASSRVHLTRFAPIDASIGYDFHLYNITFAEPLLEDLEGEAASTRDMFHVVSLMIGYGF
jgi:hypothetical protein